MRAVGNMLVMCRLYLRNEARQLQFHVFRAALLPTALIYLGTRLLSGADVSAFFAAAVTAGLAFSGVALVGYSMLEDRFSGRLASLRATPAGEFAYVACYAVIASVQALVIAGVACASLWASGLGRVSLHAVVQLPIIAIGCGLACMGLGVIAARSVDTPEGGDGLILLLGLGLPFASPTFYPVASLPNPLQILSALCPFVHLSRALDALLSGRPEQPLTLIALAATGALVAGCAAFPLLSKGRS